MHSIRLCASACASACAAGNSPSCACLPLRHLAVPGPVSGLLDPVIFCVGAAAGVMLVAAARLWLRLRCSSASAGQRVQAAPAAESEVGLRVSAEAKPRPAPAVTATALAEPGCTPGEATGASKNSVAPARLPGLRIGVLGPLTVNGQPGALLPAQTQLVVALALHRETGLPNRELCKLLGTDAGHPKPADSLRQLITRTRRQLGQAADGREWIEHLGHGQYALHKDSRLDWDEFRALSGSGMSARDAGQLARALGMVRGQPFAECYYWWLDIELVEAVTARIVAAATMLAGLSLAGHEPAAAARAARAGLAADSSAEQLWRLLMRAEHAAGNLSGVREAWSRCAEAVAEVAADGEPEAATTALYERLVGR
jgi:DNA-binding SARP family transcriptional activator